MTNGCPWEARELCMKAVQGGSIEVLSHLQQQAALNTSLLTDMLDFAAGYSNVAVAKWLREQGAEWPAVDHIQFWSEEVLAWARAEGCETLIT
jgi:hypothetical protein